MYCNKCGARLDDRTGACPNCGPTTNSAAVQNAYNNGYQKGYSEGYSNNAGTVPPEYRPLSPFAFFGLTLLYTVPIVGLIFLIINSFRRDNYCKRNHARSYWIPYIIAIIAGIVILILYLTGNAVFGFLSQSGS